MNIANQHVVTLDYQLFDDQKNLIDSSTDGEQLIYLHGGDELFDKLEEALSGKAVGDEITVTLQPDDAYGPEHEELIRTHHIDEFNGVEMRPGMELQGKDPDGNYRLLRVIDVKGDQVHINMNHPLAGMVLVFVLTVMDVRRASEQEIQASQAS